MYIRGPSAVDVSRNGCWFGRTSASTQYFQLIQSSPSNPNFTRQRGQFWGGGGGGQGVGAKASKYQVSFKCTCRINGARAYNFLNLQRILMGQSPCRNGTSERLRSVQSLELCLYIFYQCATFCLDFLCICLFVFFLQDSA